MITDTIQRQIFEAMRAKDEVRLSTLKMLSSALNYDKIAKQHDLSEEEELVIVRSEAKKRRDASESYKKAGADARAEGEEAELAILEEYLPAQVSDEELAKIVDEILSETGVNDISGMGRAIGAVMARAKGQADGGRVAQMVKAKLT
ncbi:MAG: GatB/YqeY domain-containing protein [Patescibacteria group bacterium]